MHRVDIFVPCYNYGRYLRDCVASVTSQEGVEVRVLIIDDASSDNSEEIGRQLAAEDSRVTYTRHPRNRGHIATYNEGLDWAAYDYTLLLSADDMLTPGALFRATSVMEANPRVGLTFGRSIRLVEGKPAEPVPDKGQNFAARIWSGPAWLKFVFCDRSTFFEAPAVLVRTRMYKEYGGYRADLPHTADVEMWLRCAAHGELAEIDADQAYYRIHSANMHGVLAPTALASLQYWKDAYDAFFEHHASYLPNEGQFREWAYGSIARMALSAAYARKYRREAELRRKLIDLALRTSPAIGSARGQFAAGYESGRIRQPWAVRKVLGAPAYLFRRAADHTWRALRSSATADLIGARFEAGRTWGDLSLTLEAWQGKPGPLEAAMVSGDCTLVQIGQSQRMAT